MELGNEKKAGSFYVSYCFAAACKFEVRPLLSVAKFMEMENGGTVVG